MKYSEIDKNKALTLIEQGALLFDVREPVDFRNGTWNNAKNLPINRLGEVLFPLKKTAKIVVFGKNSLDQNVAVVMNYIHQLGFTNAYSIKGGFDKLD